MRHCCKSNDAQVSNPEELKQATQCWMSTSSWDLQGVHGRDSLPTFVYRYKDGGKTGLIVQPIGGFRFPKKRFLSGV